MSRVPSTPETTQLWLLDPRDPVVLGDGRGAAAFGAGNTWPFPHPGTVAGMVRTALLRGETQVSPDKARDLLKIRVRGPWLVRVSHADGVQPNEEPVGSLRFPAPADALLEEKPSPAGQEPPDPDRLVGGQVTLPGGEEGFTWPAWPQDVLLGEQATPRPPQPRSLVHLPERTEAGAKRRRFDQRFWPLDLLVHWSLGQRPADRLQQVIREADDELNLLHRERRIHVSLDDETGTAEAGMLYETSGLRLSEGWQLGMEVEYPSPIEDGTQPWPPALPEGKTLTLLGGEARPSFLEVQSLDHCPIGAFPGFTDFEPDYHRASVTAAGLRLQLLTPAYLPVRRKTGDVYHQPGDPGWCPSWLLDSPASGAGRHHPAVRELLERKGLRLRLEALCLSGFQVVSGWNLQGGRERPSPRADARLAQRTGAPREVRRLVPAGSVYYLYLEPFRASAGEIDPDLWIQLCKALWGRSMDPEGPGEDAANLQEDFRAPSAGDGFGLVLPGFWQYGPQDS
ncbi:MAG: type III-B CRISPR module-associated protein Cmr3 [Proteobacteria bacterium]|nr:type III-B CRISPR module-associated protein Cmr3 [Pseudomonadota bacterium]